jgi:hypothetical protein
VDKELRRTRILRRISKASEPIWKFGVLVTMVLSIIAVAQINQERRDRRNFVNDAICSLVRAVPPGNPRIDQVRSDLSCGPYVRPGFPVDSNRNGTTSPKPRSSSTPTSGSEPEFPIPPGIIYTTPSATAGKPPSQPPVKSKPASRTPTKVPPRPSPSRATPTPSSSATPPSTTPLLPIPLCSISVLGKRLC